MGKVVRATDVRNVGKVLALVLLINALAFVSVGLLHEAGHAVFGMNEGCSDVEVVFSAEETFTRMHCPSDVSRAGLSLSSFLFILPASSLLFVLGRRILRNTAIIVLGANVLGAGADVLFIFPSESAKYATLALGIVTVIYGQNALVSSVFDHFFGPVSPPLNQQIGTTKLKIGWGRS